MLCRSRAVCMGYLHSEQKTRDTIDDEGWLHSGDLVRADQEGFYKVVGRIKEIIIPAGGENVAPTNIEDEIKLALPSLASNVMVVGDGKQYLTCLITLKAGLVSSISNVTGAVCAGGGGSPDTEAQPDSGAADQGLGEVRWGSRTKQQ